MARRNGVWYEARLVNNRGQSKVTKSRSGKLVLDLVLAEGFRQKNSQAPDKFKDPTKAPDDYVDTHTAWHKLRAYAEAGDERFLALVTNPIFNHGAVVTIDASYQEEEPWKDKGDVVHAGRQEQVFFGSYEEDGYIIEIKVHGDTVLGARDDWAKPLWDGVSELPSTGGSGGGAPAAPEYREDEGF